MTQPRAQLQDEQVLKDVASAQSFLNGCLSTLRDGGYYGREFVIFPELLTDNTKLVNPGDRSGRGLNQSINLSGAHLNIWFIYRTINRINRILEAIEDGEIVITSQLDNVAITKIKAQALFLRGLMYFDLVRTYSYNPNYIIKNWDKGIPYLTESVRTKTEIPLPSRPTVVDTYENIEADLLAAVDAFTATGSPDASSPGTNAASNAPSNARFVPTRAATYALLARLYLYWGGPNNRDKYESAINYANLAIASNFASLSASGAALTTNWTTNTGATANPESIFEINFASTAENLGGDNSLEGWYTRNVNASGARVTGWGDVIASDELLADYEAADVRLTGLMQQARRDFEPIASRETRKYKSTGQFGQDNIPLIRLPEMYLILAEAHFYKATPDEAASRAALNAILGARTGSSAVGAGVTGTDLENRIFLERRRELAFEGHRLFDMLRRGQALTKPGGSTIAYDDFRVLANVPLTEVQANPNLEQNPGY